MAKKEQGIQRDKMLPDWHGWHAARRGLGTNLYRLAVPEKTIQAIVRQANVSTTNTYYIRSAADDARAPMAKPEKTAVGNGGMRPAVTVANKMSGDLGRDGCSEHTVF
jgi:integrase